MKQRNIGIDVLKCLAAILITNSHMDALYGSYSVLSTGAIGDSLFFFISGFTLFLGSTPRFDNWYKRRINRIYPTVFAWAILSCAVFGNDRNMLEIIWKGGGWFVSCIMLYYLAMYPIKRYAKNRLWLAFSVISVAVLILYFTCGYKDALYNGMPYFNFSWSLYFLFMLFGAILGTKWKEMDYSRTKMNIVALVGCVVLFYGIQFAVDRFVRIPQLKILSVVPLFGISWFLFKVCNSAALVRLYNYKAVGLAIQAIGSLCLEIYIVQFSLFTTRMNNLFPLNILIMFLIIFVAAYILRCCARIFAQTFREVDYDWKAVFKIV